MGNGAKAKDLVEILTEAKQVINPKLHELSMTGAFGARSYGRGGKRDSGGGASMSCYKCGERGHKAVSCQQGRGGGEALVDGETIWLKMKFKFVFEVSVNILNIQ